MTEQQKIDMTAPGWRIQLLHTELKPDVLRLQLEKDGKLIRVELGPATISTLETEATQAADAVRVAAEVAGQFAPEDTGSAAGGARGRLEMAQAELDRRVTNLYSASILHQFLSLALVEACQPPEPKDEDEVPEGETSTVEAEIEAPAEPEPEPEPAQKPKKRHQKPE